jgi:predicted dehydrogenase
VCFVVCGFSAVEEIQTVNVAIVGCGLIGQKRAALLGGCRLVVCADLVRERADRLARALGADATDDWRAAVRRDDVQLVLISAVHKALPEITLEAVRLGKHCLVEKPAARRPDELTPIIAEARRTGALVRVGFNHRYHPAILKARELIEAGALGDLMYLRARYGHGGRVGYDREWRADPDLSGGGELIDQGTHLIDLARLFLGDFASVEGFAHTYFWDMPVDDNAFLVLRTADRRAAFLHASCTEWKNLFSMEVYGRKGKLDLFGLGGSYGTERVTLYQMRPEMGPPDTTSWEFPRGDDSWRLELAELLDDVRLGRQPSPGLADAQAVLRVVETVYARSAA